MKKLVLAVVAALALMTLPAAAQAPVPPMGQANLLPAEIAARWKVLKALPLGNESLDSETLRLAELYGRAKQMREMDLDQGYLLVLSDTNSPDPSRTISAFGLVLTGTYTGQYVSAKLNPDPKKRRGIALLPITGDDLRNEFLFYPEQSN